MTMMLHKLTFLLICCIGHVSAFQDGVFGAKVARLSAPSGRYPLRSPGSQIQKTVTRIIVTQRQASETSSSFVDVISSKAEDVKIKISESVQNLNQAFPLLSFTADSVLDVAKKSWWMMPMFLAVIPLYCAFVKGTCAAMPEWWQVVNMDYIRQSADATLVVGCFLFSNMAYFLSGAYLLHKFPCKKSENNGFLFQPTRFSMLGIWILASGLVSTIFHSVQALGSYALASALCYIDHAFAISSGFYYLETCGRPSKRVLGMGLISLVALVLTHPGYAWLHSIWHVLSAATATRWAIEGHARTTENR